MRRFAWLVPVAVVGLWSFQASIVGVVAAEPNAKPETDAQAKPADGQAKPDEKLEFLRVIRDKAGTPTAMQTAVVRYTATEGKYAGKTVELVGAIHVGEKTYYGDLNKLFTKYDVLLYELVAPEGTKIPKGGGGRRSGHPVAMLQNGMSDMLGLVHQMTEVDYTKKNFVHADMTPDEFSKKMEERGESWWKMALQAMGQSMAMQAAKPQDHPELEIFAAFFDPHPELKMKRALAKQFESMEGMMEAFGGKDGSTIITERNKKALEVLAKQLDAGKQVVGIFYGAGHLPDMHKRLAADFGMQPVNTDWITAWDMTEPPAKAHPKAKPDAKKKPTRVDAD